MHSANKIQYASIPAELARRAFTSAGLPRDPPPPEFGTAGLGGASHGVGGGLHGRQVLV